MAPAQSTSTSWWRQLCWDHPSYASKHPDSFADGGSKHPSKPKVFCKACWTHRIEAEQRKDNEELSRGERQAIRGRGMIEDYLWAFSHTDKHAPWMHGRVETIIRHLASCPHVDQAIRDVAVQEKIDRRLTISKSPSRLAQQQSSQSTTAAAPTLQPVYYQPLASSSSPMVLPGATGTPQPPTPMSMHPGMLFSHSAPSTSPLSMHPSPYSSQCNIPSPLHSSFSGVSALSDLESPQLSPLGSPCISNLSVAGPALARPPPAKRRRTGFNSSQVTTEWTSANQAQFDSMIARITASCGFPFLWVENPEWLRFVREFIPHAISPSRRVLANRLIPDEVQLYRATAKSDCKGQNSTLQYDGWTGINNHHFLVFQMSSSNRTIHTVRVIDTSGERKTADLLYQKLHDVKKEVETKWGVVVVAITGDASGESLRARKDFIISSPHLLAPDCYAHQINLMVSDYFKAPNATELLAYGEDATELITWLRSKTFVLAKMRAIQSTNGHPILSVRRAVLTRWTSHYSAYERLLKLRLVLELVVAQDENLSISDIITGKRAAKDKARAMMKKIQDSMFWHNLARLKKHLEPLALAANITQLAHIRPDQVLIMFGILYTQYNALMAEDPSYHTWAALQAVLDSIEKRWKKTEQDAFIASVILNPVYKLKPFDRSCHFATLAGVIALLKELFIRFFGPLSDDEDQAFFEEVSEYLNNHGRYKDLSNHAQHISNQAKRTGKHADPIVMWDGVRHPETPYSPLQKLARRLHSICVNSASCERLFSLFGIILTRLRSRLRPQAMTDLAELRMYLRDEHMRLGEVKEHIRKRKMTSHHAKSNEGTIRESNTTPNDEPEADPPASVAGATAPSSDHTSIHQIIAQLKQLEDNDDTARLESRAGTNASGGNSTETRESIPIKRLFNFQDDTWAEIAKAVSMRGLEEEMELYDLIDLDAAGEDDNGVDGQDGSVIDDDFIASSLNLDS